MAARRAVPLKSLCIFYQYSGKWDNCQIKSIDFFEVIGMSDLQLPHKLTLNERKNLTLTGVSEVIAFDENMVLLETNLGRLEVQGENLQLKNLSLDGGQVAVDGDISALYYAQPREKGGFLKRFSR